MKTRTCTCGAEPDLRDKTQIRADGQRETIYWVGCPVCGQTGPYASDFGKGKDAAVAEAIAAWNAMIAAVRPLEA